LWIKTRIYWRRKIRTDIMKKLMQELAKDMRQIKNKLNKIGKKLENQRIMNLIRIYE